MTMRDPQLEQRASSSVSYHLTTFGSFSLRAADGHAVTGLGRKTRALVAYLALTRGIATREELADLLWSERGLEQGRASLRQACYELRHRLPADAPLLLMERDEISLVSGRLMTDIDEFDDVGYNPEVLLDTLDLRHRDLLRDLGGLSPAFDNWLAVERVRRADERRVKALVAAQSAIESGRWPDAQAIACAHFLLDPTDRETTEMALYALQNAGDATGARTVFARHASALRYDLDITPAASTVALLDIIKSGHHSGKPSAPRTSDAGDGMAEAGMLLAADGNVAVMSRAAESHLRSSQFARTLGLGALAGGALVVGFQFISAHPSHSTTRQVNCRAVTAPSAIIP